MEFNLSVFPVEFVCGPPLSTDPEGAVIELCEEDTR